MLRSGPHKSKTPATAVSRGGILTSKAFGALSKISKHSKVSLLLCCALLIMFSWLEVVPSDSQGQVSWVGLHRWTMACASLETSTNSSHLWFPPELPARPDPPPGAENCEPRDATFNSSQYWNRRYHMGGNGGENVKSERVLHTTRIINDFCSHNAIQRVVEFGFGDGQQLSLTNYPSYVGLETSPAALERTAFLYKDDPTKKFSLIQGRVTPGTYQADLVLSLAVIMFLVEDELYEEHMQSIFAVQSKYVLIYSTNYYCRQAAHVNNRKFTDWVDQNQAHAYRLVKTAAGHFTQRADIYLYERKDGGEMPCT